MGNAVKINTVAVGDGRGVKVTVKNHVKVANWASQWVDAEAVVHLDSDGRESQHRVRVKTKKGWRVANIGDYVVRNGEQISVLKAAAA